MNFPKPSSEERREMKLLMLKKLLNYTRAEGEDFLMRDGKFKSELADWIVTQAEAIPNLAEVLYDWKQSCCLFDTIYKHIMQRMTEHYTTKEILFIAAVGWNTRISEALIFSCS